jgi:erythronate-4-phosphate dehydrogenase
MKIVCDNKIPFLEGALEPYAEVVYLPGNKTTADVVRDADALITRTRTICNESLLKGSKVKLIATATIGFDHIDTEWCDANDIEWTNAPGCNSSSVEQYIGSLLVTMAHEMNFRLSDKTVGIIGVGNVGSKIAKLANILGLKVLLNDPPRARKEGDSDFVSLDELIMKSDIITCHVPLQRDGEDATYHLFDAKRLNSLREDQILINSSRGEVIDNKALKDVLKDGKIRAASLDVWENEPNIDSELLDLLFTGTPHIAGYSLDGKANGTTMSVQAIGCKFGLPCKEWIVKEIPSPIQTLNFTIDTNGKDEEDVLSEAILHTYRIKEDDTRLRNDITTFEQQRASYPVRREFSAFTLTMKGSNRVLEDKLLSLGFNIK